MISLFGAWILMIGLLGCKIPAPFIGEVSLLEQLDEKNKCSIQLITWKMDSLVVIVYLQVCTLFSGHLLPLVL